VTDVTPTKTNGLLLANGRGRLPVLQDRRYDRDQAHLEPALSITPFAHLVGKTADVAGVVPGTNAPYPARTRRTSSCSHVSRSRRERRVK
jgi:hypothetical protein